MALLTSLFLALTFTPVLAERFIRVKREKRPRRERAAAYASDPAYEWLLAHALANRAHGADRHRRPRGAHFLHLTNASAPSFCRSSRSTVSSSTTLRRPGASLDETDRMLRHVEAMLKETPEVDGYSRRTGLQLGLAGVTEPNTGDFAVKLKDNAVRRPTKSRAPCGTRSRSSEPALRVEFLGILSDLIGDLVSSPEPIEIQRLQRRCGRAASHGRGDRGGDRKVDGVVDVFNGIVVSGPASPSRSIRSARRFTASLPPIRKRRETAPSAATSSRT